MGDKIPSERQEIWSKGLGQLYRPLQGWSSYIGSKMHVTDLCNSESVELLRQSVEPYVDAVGYQVLRFQENGVGGRARCYRASPNQKTMEKSPACPQLPLHTQESSIAVPLTISYRCPLGLIN